MRDAEWVDSTAVSSSEQTSADAVDPITVVIPARAGSERVPQKNTKPFAEIPGGLLQLKLQQLALVEEIDKIIVSSNDPLVLSVTEDFAKTTGGSRFIPLERPDELGRSSTPMSQFINYVATLENHGTMCMTHVTHPLLRAEYFRELIRAWREAASAGHDSLLTVTKLQTFLWDENGPYNYDPSQERWPRSQDIKPLYEINHGAYFIPFQRMREVGDRVGTTPKMYELPENAVLDIDWPEQFQLLEDMALARSHRGVSLL
ncbi:hypothetical protein GCM10009672_16670 [Nesterenkonia lutea]